ncbi:SRPBCC family protein [Micromonospora sp. HM5-17]|uniref:SRPBCC family protein n=1 Tax=Micromonospora sp. HM5-17 TaxID=2487710 RepID=UPI000F488285|nr:SRPBCC family protein [Micromonospora sp. HM5-17]ROT31995.1 SRPBCC family protein [Micromonospora sp. HM5-17]
MSAGGDPGPGPDGPAAGDDADLRAAARPGAGEVTATVIVAAPASRVFAALTAWERQGEWIPFTRVRLIEGDGGEGSLVEAITRVGPAALRDEMRVVRFDAPYEVRVVHCGRLLRGPGVLRCTPMGRDRTQVVWHEWFHLPGGVAGRVAWPVLWPGSKVGLTQALRRFARLVEGGRLP